MSHTSEADTNRRTLLETLEKAEFEKNQAIKLKSDQHKQEFDSVERRSTGTLESQRRHYEEIIDTQKLDFAAKLHEFKQKSEFESNMERREFVAKQNEMIRNYEKRITAMQSEQLGRINEIKEQSEKVIRDKDRSSRLALDEQARSYEHRLTQLDYSQKEREKYQAQVFEDQLEKVKRTNAELIKKKS
jgi:hypothetical protein